MRLNLPWWINPWAEVRRLRGRVAYHRDAEESAVRTLVEVESYAKAELRHLRLREAAVFAENTRLLNMIVEQTHLVAPKIMLVDKEAN